MSSISRIFTNALPYLNFVIGCSALFVQTTILHPWHAKLDEGYEETMAHGQRLVKNYHREHMAKFKLLQESIRQIQREIDRNGAGASGTPSADSTNDSGTTDYTETIALRLE